MQTKTKSSTFREWIRNWDSLNFSLCYLNANFPLDSYSHVHAKRPKYISIAHTDTHIHTAHCKVYLTKKQRESAEKTKKIQQAHNRIEWTTTNQVRKKEQNKNILLQLSKCHLTSSNFKNGLPPTIEHTNELQNEQRMKKQTEKKTAYAFSIIRESFFLHCSFAPVIQVWFFFSFFLIAIFKPFSSFFYSIIAIMLWANGRRNKSTHLHCASNEYSVHLYRLNIENWVAKSKKNKKIIQLHFV